VLDVVLPLSELRRAHEMIDERTHFGKIVLKVD
jgi:NADPH:quinone reductase-like Zn-dependent oxidoreductase